MICIDRCLCFNRTFAELYRLAQASGSESLEALQAQVLFGQKCQLCHPYVQEMLKTGETCFNRIIQASPVTKKP